MEQFTFPDRALPIETITSKSKIIFAVTKNKQILLSKKYIDWSDTSIYSFPSAVVDDYQNEKDTLIVLEEETWYSSDEQIIYIWDTSSNWYSDWLNHIFLAKNCYKKPEKKHILLHIFHKILTHTSVEKNSIEYMGLEELDTLVVDSKLFDPYSVTNYYFIKSKTNNFKDLEILSMEM